ncbi:MAG: GNAT family N-acetyltransferase [Anaerolineae bacterium]|nr:GNAT family N-acetyltransferase [Anaerolineae bacterium]
MDHPAEPPIPHKSILMVCRTLNHAALRPLPEGLTMRLCRPDELDVWKELQAAPRDGSSREALDRYYDKWFAPYGDLFFHSCTFVCDQSGTPIGTGFIWKPEGQPTLLHWIKVLQAHEGRGIGRALVSQLMRDLPQSDYPVYLHTQPASYRAVKLYSDLGFDLVAPPGSIDGRPNELAEALPYLERHLRPEDFRRLRIVPLKEG